MATADTYTFGDTPDAARRLALLADVYQPATTALLTRWSPPDVEHAIDLGCGPGHSTVLLHRLTRAGRTTGVERSPTYVAAARACAPQAVEYVCADVTGDFPVLRADVVLARFLLTHLRDPSAAIGRWASLVAPGGRLLLQETARLETSDPVIARYYELVGELQAHHGQALNIGARLVELAQACDLTIEHTATRQLRPPIPAMATLHALNLRTWRSDPYAREAFDVDELDLLEDALADIALGRVAAHVIEQDLAELVLTHRPDADVSEPARLPRCG